MFHSFIAQENHSKNTNTQTPTHQHSNTSTRKSLEKHQHSNTNTPTLKHKHKKITRKTPTHKHQHRYLIRSHCISSCSYVTTPLGCIDLLAFLPTCVGFYFTGTFHATAYWRSLRLLRLLKAERMLRSFSVFYVVFRDNAQIFMVLVFVMMLMWLFCSTLMYYAERDNPDWSMARYYQSIPGAMWVTLLNLTGESPLCDFTFFGKIVTAFMGIFGVGVFAIPIGLFGTFFVSSLQQQQQTFGGNTDIKIQPTHRCRLGRCRIGS